MTEISFHLVVPQVMFFEYTNGNFVIGDVKITFFSKKRKNKLHLDLSFT